jgi:RNA polymerase sigma-70 factor (ECF subfamily)
MTSLLNPEKWVDLHGDILFRFAMMRVGNPETASELVQETFLAALKSSSQFKGKSSERTWLIGILKFKILDHFRGNQKSKTEVSLQSHPGEEIDRFFQKSGPWKDHPQSWGQLPSKTLENKELLAVFQRCVRELPDRLRQIFTLREIDQIKSDEVCNVFQISPTNLVVMMHRARLRLRKCLEVKWFGTPGKEEPTGKKPEK